jgi:hypothetical protein
VSVLPNETTSKFDRNESIISTNTSPNLSVTIDERQTKSKNDCNKSLLCKFVV